MLAAIYNRFRPSDRGEGPTEQAPLVCLSIWSRSVKAVIVPVIEATSILVRYIPVSKTKDEYGARRHRPMPALSPRASASPKRHVAELWHHAGIARGRADHPRARAP